MEVKEVFFFFFDGWKEENHNCKFPRFHLGEKETPSCGMPDKVVVTKVKIFF